MNNLISQFKKIYNQQPSLKVCAPGRVNLIGEHTDYNNGFVLPIAINLELCLLAAPRQDREVHIFAADFNETKTFSLDNINQQPEDGWLAYVKGVAHILQTQFSELNGFNAIIQSSIPLGAGLSSSAALELGIARAFAEFAKIEWQPVTMARLMQRAENEWVGVNCGIMDQLSIAIGKRNFAALIDCRSFTTEYVPLSAAIAIVIMDTTTRRGLVTSAYNERRRQCETVASILNIESLRDATLAMMLQNKEKFSSDCFKRAQHVISENERVLKTCEAMRQNDYSKIGQLLNASHQSLQNDFEVSSNYLDLMVQCAREFPECYGARMTGAGFGGCAIALVAAKEAENFRRFVQQKYFALTQKNAPIYITQAVDGVGTGLLVF